MSKLGDDHGQPRHRPGDGTRAKSLPLLSRSICSSSDLHRPGYRCIDGRRILRTGAKLHVLGACQARGTGNKQIPVCIASVLQPSSRQCCRLDDRLP